MLSGQFRRAAQCRRVGGVPEGKPPARAGSIHPLARLHATGGVRGHPYTERPTAMVAPVAITSVSRPHEDSKFCADASVSAGPAVAVAVSLWVRFSFASKPESVSQNAPGTSRHSERRCRREHHRGAAGRGKENSSTRARNTGSPICSRPRGAIYQRMRDCSKTSARLSSSFLIALHSCSTRGPRRWWLRIRLTLLPASMAAPTLLRVRR
jgi:hypothetical protein